MARVLKAVVVLALVGVFGCGDGSEEPDADVELGRSYASDAAFRRGVLEGSLVNPDNGYSELRLARYTEDQWGQLPVWAPGEFAEVDAVPWEREALLALGRRAFFRYPMQLVPALEHGLADPDAYGVHTGLVRVERAGGDGPVGLACAGCHSVEREGATVAGLNNADFDLRGMVLAARGLPRGPSWWGPGRVDVTADGVDNPVAIPDLRPVRYQTHLHRAATVRNGLIELSIRTETLIITAMGENHRPPRKLAFALALYLWNLAPAPPTVRPAVFDRTCGGCHGSEGLSGPPVVLARVGTRDAVARSAARTTGMWRVPSLVGVGDRRRLTATGDIHDVAHMLADDRNVPGHVFGQRLAPREKRALLGFLETL